MGGPEGRVQGRQVLTSLGVRGAQPALYRDHEGSGVYEVKGSASLFGGSLGGQRRVGLNVGGWGWGPEIKSRERGKGPRV